MYKPSDYDKLECPDCNKICKPVKVKKNGTVGYQTHECTNGEDHFEIDIEGNLID